MDDELKKAWRLALSHSLKEWLQGHVPRIQQKKLAVLLDIPYGVLNQISNGYMIAMDQEIYAKLFAVLGLPAADPVKVPPLSFTAPGGVTGETVRAMSESTWETWRREHQDWINQVRQQLGISPMQPAPVQNLNQYVRGMATLGQGLDQLLVLIAQQLATQIVQHMTDSWHKDEFTQELARQIVNGIDRHLGLPGRRYDDEFLNAITRIVRAELAGNRDLAEFGQSRAQIPDDERVKLIYRLSEALLTQIEATLGDDQESLRDQIVGTSGSIFGKLGSLLRNFILPKPSREELIKLNREVGNDQ